MTAMVRDRASVVAVKVVRIVTDLTRAGADRARVCAAVAVVLREEFAEIESQLRDELQHD